MLPLYRHADMSFEKWLFEIARFKHTQTLAMRVLFWFYLWKVKKHSIMNATENFSFGRKKLYTVAICLLKLSDRPIISSNFWSLLNVVLIIILDAEVIQSCREEIVCRIQNKFEFTKEYLIILKRLWKSNSTLSAEKEKGPININIYII